MCETSNAGCGEWPILLSVAGVAGRKYSRMQGAPAGHWWCWAGPIRAAIQNSVLIGADTVGGLRSERLDNSQVVNLGARSLFQVLTGRGCAMLRSANEPSASVFGNLWAAVWQHSKPTPSQMRSRCYRGGLVLRWPGRHGCCAPRALSHKYALTSTKMRQFFMVPGGWRIFRRRMM